jgi:nucleotide-binding universal stress UspA family protein
MFETIIWATDGSERADAVLSVVEELARTHKSKIVAVHATQLFRGGRFGGGPLLADDDELRLKIRAQVDELRAAGFAAELEVKAGDRQNAAELIAAAAEEKNAGLIVVGTHGSGAIATAVVGSVTRHLLHVAPCPVLAVPPRLKVSIEQSQRTPTGASA